MKVLLGRGKIRWAMLPLLPSQKPVSVKVNERKQIEFTQQATTSAMRL
ncbi:MAG: hypothetical protein WCF23_15405 [Candidatus Nitrosopolaris sp.]